MNEQLHAVVHGRVQGVSFRYNTLSEAQRLGVMGWVRNLPQGTVEVLAEGDRAALEDLLAYLNAGPPGARVTRVEVEWQRASGQHSSFTIR